MNMDERIEDDDREALAGLSSSAPRPRKSLSYTQQLRGSSAHKRHHQVRKHSLDDAQINPRNSSSNNSNNSNYSSSDDEDDDFFPYSSNSAPASGEHDEQGLCVDGGSSDQDPRQCQGLPEFIGSGGGSGVFKVPSRAAVHPGRPPCLELRPHPLRETQVGKFLRNIACTERQLWTGQEGGVRVWNFQEGYEAGCGVGGRATRGDEDAAPFHESAATPPVMSLLIDDGNRLVWSGHKDGKIRSWRMDTPLSPSPSPFKEGLSWQAHRSPVLAIAMTSHGALSLFISFLISLLFLSFLLNFSFSSFPSR